MAHREAVRVKVKKCEQSIPPEWRKFSVDPQITSLEVLYSLLAKAFDIKSDFSIKYKAFDPAGNEIYLPVLSDWDLDAAFLRIHNLSIQTATEPCLILQIDIKPFTEVKEWDAETPSSASGGMYASGSSASAAHTPSVSTIGARELISPLQQSFGVSQKYVQHMQTKLPGLIMNQMEKTFSIVQKAFNLSEETMASLPPRTPLSDSEFRLFLDAVGQIQRTDELRKVIFFGGIEPSLRRVVWKHILNVYPCGMNGHQRMDYMRRKSEHYYRLRDVWKTAIKQGYVVGELSYVTSMVKKDVLRTDRLHPFYAGSDDNQNIASLFNILTTFALNHPSVSYCQGMSDIASPLLVTMNDEAQAYICFCAIMARVSGNFMLDGIAMTQKFAHLTEALSFYDPDFWEYLKSQQADDLLFCYRWLLLEMKREFPFDDALRMLEVQWSSLKYETSIGKELSLFEKEFVPITESSAPTTSSSLSGSLGGVTPISPSYLLAKQRENPYTKVCALRRQSSSASLSSLSSSFGSSTNATNALDATRRLNQSLDENISHRSASSSARRSRHASAKAHQSLDESKMFMLMESVANLKNSDNKSICTDSNSIIDHNDIVANDEYEDGGEDDDVFQEQSNSNNDVMNHLNFHHTNPFKEDVQVNAHKITSDNYEMITEQVTTTTTAKDCDNLNELTGEESSSNDIAANKAKALQQFPHGIAKLHNQKILSNYNTVSNIIAKQIVNAANVGETVRRVSSNSSSSGGGHFKDLKEKIAATSRRGLSLEDANSNSDKSQQKLVKNFNEFLNFATINKSRIADRFNNTPTTITPISNSNINTKTKSIKCIENIDDELIIASPTNGNSIAHTTTVLQPLVQLTKAGFATSLDESEDSSSVPDTTWSGSTAATAIQQTNNLSSNSLHLELNSSYASSMTHTPERTPAEKPTTMTAASSDSYCSSPLKQIPNDSSSPTPEDQEYYPMTTAITRELRLEAENLDRQVFGDPIDIKLTHNSTSSEIEYEKLGKDSLDLVEDLKENEIISCPALSELLVRRRKRELQTSSSIAPLLCASGTVVSSSSAAHDDNLNIDEKRSANAAAFRAASLDLPAAAKMNPFIDESLLGDSKMLAAAGIPNSCSLPEVIVPISTDMANALPVELATNASDEIAFSKVTHRIAPDAATALETTTTTPMLPAPTEFGGGNPFLMFLCLTLLLQHRNTIMKTGMDYNEIAMHFDKMVRKHDVTRVLNEARRMYIEYLKMQKAYTTQRLQATNLMANDINKNAANIPQQRRTAPSSSSTTTVATSSSYSSTTTTKS